MAAYGGAYNGTAPEAPFRQFKSGAYYTVLVGGNDAAQSPGQSTECAMRFEVGVATTFDRIGVEVTTNAASNVYRLGIRYDSGSGYPGSLLLDAGTVDASTTGAKEITISQVLTPGLWWLTCTLQGGTGAAVRGRPGPDPYIAQGSILNANYGSYTQGSVTGALPASFSSTLVPSGSAPKVYLRAA